MVEGAHCRFDAIGRQYGYTVYARKDPFIADRGYYYPYRLNMERMREAAEAVREYSGFEAFSKRNTQVKTFRCRVIESRWEECDGYYTYTVRANRFLRGMVRAIVGTLLDVGTGKITQKEFASIIQSRDRKRAGANVPAYGLYLEKVKYPSRIFVK